MVFQMNSQIIPQEPQLINFQTWQATPPKNTKRKHAENNKTVGVASNRRATFATFFTSLCEKKLNEWSQRNGHVITPDERHALRAFRAQSAQLPSTRDVPGTTENASVYGTRKTFQFNEPWCARWEKVKLMSYRS